MRKRVHADRVIVTIPSKVTVYRDAYDSVLLIFHLGPVSWRPTTVKWRQSSQSNRHSTIGTRQTECHEALPSSANVQSHLTSSFADDGNASWYSVCRVPMVEWWFDCEDCRPVTVVGLHDTGPWSILYNSVGRSWHFLSLLSCYLRLLGLLPCRMHVCLLGMERT